LKFPPPGDDLFQLADSTDRAFTITQITEAIRGLLDSELSKVTVEGEISSWKVAGTGHAYFSLKDENALLKAVMWRSRLGKLANPPAEGQMVRATGSITVYAPRGEYQLDVVSIRQAGMGALQKRFEELKRRLEKEGLFDPSRKRNAPLLIQRVLVITSPSAAALQDFLTNLDLENTPVEVLVLPVRVQGVEAPAEIVNALQAAPEHHPDLVVLTRGGGSLEDLWAFNEEAVARAIAACPVPVLSAVGHEVDFTIADFTADIRVSTPTAAGRFLAEQAARLVLEIDSLRERLVEILEDDLAGFRQSLESLQRELAARSPQAFLPFYHQRIDDLLGRAAQSIRQETIDQWNRLREINRQLVTTLQMDLLSWKGRMQAETQRLMVLNPHSTLARGYALCEGIESGQVVRSRSTMPPAGDIRIQFVDGSVDATPHLDR